LYSQSVFLSSSELSFSPQDEIFATDSISKGLFGIVLGSIDEQCASHRRNFLELISYARQGTGVVSYQCRLKIVWALLGRPPSC
jgi:hypothetical protein